MEKEASVIGNEVKELKRQLKEAKQTEKQNLKEEKKERKKQQKLEQARFREEERMRKVQIKEEKKLKKELDKPEVHKENISNLRDDRRKEKKEQEPDLDLLPVTWVSSYLPIRQIKNGVIYTTDHRYVKLIEILPINFLLRSSSEQRNIIMSFMSYLKIAPVKIQFKVVSKKADISEYIEKIKEEAEREPDHRVKLLQEDYAKLIERLGRKEAITRRFFMVFEYQSYNNNKNPKEREVLLYMRSVVQTAKKYLSQCGNVVLKYENDTRFLVDVLYQILNRKTSVYETLEERTKKVARYYQRENGRESISHIPVTELIAPETMDMRHRSHLVIDGMYYSYLLIPSHKYRTRVPAGWLSLLINAGEGIDVDVFFFRQDKSKSMERIGRRIRLNRSKIKDTYDTNTDWKIVDQKMTKAYADLMEEHGKKPFGNLQTFIRIVSSDVGASGANIFYSILDGDFTIVLGEALRTKHRHKQGLEEFSENMESIFQYYKQKLRDIGKLCDIRIRYPVNALSEVMKKQSFGKKLIAETVERFKTNFGEQPCSAYEIYCGLCEALFFARKSGSSPSNLVKMEEKIARCMNVRWHDYDIPGEISL